MLQPGHSDRHVDGLVAKLHDQLSRPLGRRSEQTVGSDARDIGSRELVLRLASHIAPPLAVHFGNKDLLRRFRPIELNRRRADLHLGRLACDAA